MVTNKNLNGSPLIYEKLVPFFLVIDRVFDIQLIFEPMGAKQIN